MHYVERLPLVTYIVEHDRAAGKLTFYGLTDGQPRAQMSGDLVAMTAIQISTARANHGPRAADYMAHGIVTGIMAAASTGAMVGDLPPLPPTH